MSGSHLTSCRQAASSGLSEAKVGPLEIDPRETERSLASGSTLNRFQHAFTRREAHKPPEEREVIFEVRQAQIERVNAINDCRKSAE